MGTGYKEEESPAYFKRGCDLFCAKCQHCNQSFSDDSRKNGLLVSVGKPGYFVLVGKDMDVHMVIGWRVVLQATRVAQEQHQVSVVDCHFQQRTNVL